MARIKVKIRWMPGDVLYQKECWLSNGNSTIHFASERGIDLDKLTLFHFDKQRFIFFDELNGGDHFMIRYDHMISLEVLNEGGI